VILDESTDNNPKRVPLEIEQPVAGRPQAAAPVLPSEQTSAPISVADLEDKIVAALKSCYDPEIPVNIYELGLIYSVDVTPSGAASIRMTLTSPACPAAGSLPPEVESKVRAIPGITSATVEVVWDPPWNPDRMTDAAKLQLGLF
jgi:FeS assembly SUF system protein